MDRSVEDYLAEWEARRDRGEDVSLEALCPDRPEVREELARLIALLERCDRYIAPPEGGEAEGPSPPKSTRYEVRRELGRGAAGVVYLARDTVLNRDVALKVLRPAEGSLSADDQRSRESRFRREAQVLAGLDHENIVRVHDGAVEGGTYYFVMELVSGGSLKERAPALRAAGPRVVARFMERAARAVQHAHSRGIYHRDLKPANILIDSERFVPKVADFGLAKRGATHDADTTLGLPPAEDTQATAPGCRPGTAAYMAPEQYDPNFGEVGPAADVWALGVVLYEVLTGRKPFAGATRQSLGRAVCGAEAAVADLDGPLRAIVRRCLAKRPSDRYATAGEVADALARAMEPPSRRRPALLLGLATLLSLSAWSAVHEEKDEVRFRRETAGLTRRATSGVDLVTPAGPLPPHRVCCGQGATSLRMTDEGLVVTSTTMAYVELLPVLPPPPYRIEAEIRHSPNYDRLRHQGVGVVFSAQRAESEAGTHHVLGFVGIHDAFIQPFPWPDGKWVKSRRASIQLLWYLDSLKTGSVPYKNEFVIPEHGDMYYPAVTEDGWRRIAITVTEGQRFAESSRAARLRLPGRFETPTSPRNSGRSSTTRPLRPEALFSTASTGPPSGPWWQAAQMTIRSLRVIALAGDP